VNYVAMTIKITPEKHIKLIKKTSSRR